MSLILLDLTLWDEVWNCSLPTKIKIFTWKSLHGILPCLWPLENRHVINNSSCPLCSNACEDIKHTLFLCKGSRKIWRKFGLWDIVEEVCAIDGSGSVVLNFLIMAKFIKKLVKVFEIFREIFTITAWYIWWIRRQKVQSETIQTLPQMAMSIQVLTVYFVRAFKPKQTQKGRANG
jgi:hypothetical protein